MKNIVVLIRSQLPKTDSRLQRYVHALSILEKDYVIIGWSRGTATQKKLNEILFANQARIGGGWGNLLALIKWNVFIFFEVLKLKKIYTLNAVHAVDLDSIIPVFVLCKFFSIKIIFDIYDKYTDTRKFPSVLKYIADFIEKYCAVNSDFLILADQCRVKQLKLSNANNTYIFENVPSITLSYNEKLISKECINLAYVGILEEKNRGIEDLLKSVAGRDNFKLIIAGDGPLKVTVNEYSLTYPNIQYVGPVSSKVALDILNSCDVQVGFYYKTIKNHLFASPNKYYEHLMMGKPLLTTKGTPPGRKVEFNNTGYALDEGADEINTFFNSVVVSDLHIKGTNARREWEKSYANYFSDVFVFNYKKILDSI